VRGFGVIDAGIGTGRHDDAVVPAEPWVPPTNRPPLRQCRE